MRGRIAAALLAAVVLSCVFAASTLGKSTAFEITQTRACLTHKGVVFGSATDPAIAALPATARRKVLAGVLTPGTTTLILVIGTNAADALAVRKQIAARVEFKPTATNSRSDQVGNAAWFVVSLTGRPSLASMTTVRNCLRTGPTPTKQPPLTMAAVSNCLSVHSADVLDRPTRRLVFPAIPRKLDPYLVTALVPGDSSGSSQGIFGFVLIGGTPQQSLTLRRELATALAGHLAGEVTGQGRGAAWLTTPTKRASGKQISAARGVFSDCVD